MPQSMFVIIGDPGLGESPPEPGNINPDPPGGDKGGDADRPDNGEGGGNGGGSDGGGGGGSDTPMISIGPSGPFNFEIGTKITSVDFQNFVELSGVAPNDNWITYSASGDIPSGLSISGSVLNGTPNRVGEYDLGISVLHNTTGSRASQIYRVNVNPINMDVSDMYLGYNASCTVTSNNSVRCWGDIPTLRNVSGSPYSTPVNTNIYAKSLSIGYNFACVVTSSSKVQCWGSGAQYQLGNNSRTSSAVLVDVINGSSASKVSLGYQHGCLLNFNRTVRCWGKNDYGQAFVNGSTVSLASDTGIRNAIDISSGPYHTCALLVGGAIRCWGLDTSSQVGIFKSSTNNFVISDAKKIVSGSSHNCVLTNAGSVHCWGASQKPTGGNADTPVEFAGLPPFIDIAIGHQTCGITAEKEVYCWPSGQYASATKIAALDGITTAIYGGLSHVCAKTDAGIYCWGTGTSGQLGDGRKVNSSTPVRVSGM